MDFTAAPKAPGWWVISLPGTTAAIPAFLRHSVVVDGTAYHHLNADLVEDLFLVCHYTPA